MQHPLRRGLPRVEGGEPWPPIVAVRRGLPRVEGGEPWPPVFVEVEDSVADEVVEERVVEEAKPAPRRAVALISAGFIVGLLVLLARFVLDSSWGADFVARYDGTQPLPAHAPVGFPAWLNWAHFFNMFLMALIIKTGFDIRTMKRPVGMWTSRRDSAVKLPLELWLHFTINAAWVVLGVVFYVLLFTTGQWMRIVPTSIDVIPHSLSALLQYLAFDWPTEDGWIHYNALQELAYFGVVFILSPLAALSGARMTPWWPKGIKIPTIKTARAMHFPIMVCFAAFIVVHLALVALTGLKSNLNAMFAAQHGDGWTGTILFVLSVALTTLAVALLRPSAIAPLAGLTGKVSNR